MRGTETRILQVSSPCVYMACPLLFETWAIAINVVVPLLKQAIEANKNFLVAQLEPRDANRLWLLPLIKLQCYGRINHEAGISF